MSFFSGLLQGIGNAFSGFPLIGGLLSSGIDSAAESIEQDENLKRQSKFQKDIMALQNQYNIDAFNRENAYNSPSAVLNRMNQAGLNANFLNGAQFSQSADQNSAVSSSGPDIGSTLSSMAQKRALQLEKQRFNLEKAKTKSEINLNDQSAEKARKEGILAMSQADKIENADIGNVQQSTQNMVTQESKIATEIREVEQNIRNLQQSEKLLSEQTDYQKLVNDNYVSYISAEIESLIAKGKLDEAKTLSEQQLLPYIKKNYDASIYKAYQDVAIAKQQLQINWFEARTNRSKYSEEVRHNMAVEQIQRDQTDISRDLNSALADLYKGQNDKVSAEKVALEFQQKVNDYLWKKGYWEVSYNTAYQMSLKAREEVRNLQGQNEMLEFRNAVKWVDYAIEKVLQASEVYKNVIGTSVNSVGKFVNPF